MEVIPETISASDIEAMGGPTAAMIRVWRSRGHLPAVTGHAKYTLREAAEIIVMHHLTLLGTDVSDARAGSIGINDVVLRSALRVHGSCVVFAAYGSMPEHEGLQELAPQVLKALNVGDATDKRYILSDTFGISISDTCVPVEANYWAVVNMDHVGRNMANRLGRPLVQVLLSEPSKFMQRRLIEVP